MKTARYFEEQVLRKRPYIKREWCEQALQNPVRKEVQPDGRIRQWIFIEELGKYLRVVTLEDGETVLNAFPAEISRCNMKFNYYPETDSLYIDLSEKISEDSLEVAPGVVVDFDEQGNIVGIDIDRASKIIDLSRLETNSLPLADLHIAGAKP